MKRSGTRLAIDCQNAHFSCQPTPSNDNTTNCGGFSPGFNFFGVKYPAGPAGRGVADGVGLVVGLAVDVVARGCLVAAADMAGACATPLPFDVALHAAIINATAVSPISVAAGRLFTACPPGAWCANVVGCYPVRVHGGCDGS